MREALRGPTDAVHRFPSELAQPNQPLTRVPLGPKGVRELNVGGHAPEVIGHGRVRCRFHAKAIARCLPQTAPAFRPVATVDWRAPSALPTQLRTGHGLEVRANQDSVRGGYPRDPGSPAISSESFDLNGQPSPRR